MSFFQHAEVSNEQEAEEDRSISTAVVSDELDTSKVWLLGFVLYIISSFSLFRTLDLTA